jgi:hypothetical protein
MKNSHVKKSMQYGNSIREGEVKRRVSTPAWDQEAFTVEIPHVLSSKGPAVISCEQKQGRT